MKFSQVREDVYKDIQLGAGILYSGDFTFSGDNSGEIDKSAIIGTTSGGINFTATPNWVDFGDDLDNVPKNTIELKRCTYWDASLSGTFKSVDTALLGALLASDTITGQKETTLSVQTLTPQHSGDILMVDYRKYDKLWFIGDYSAKNSGDSAGFIAVKMLNALSTGGFQIQTTDKEKGAFAFTFTAHYNLAEPDTVPFEAYIGYPKETSASG
jgi:hypothetical protein